MASVIAPNAVVFIIFFNIIASVPWIRAGLNCGSAPQVPHKPDLGSSIISTDMIDKQELLGET
jgi:hypothetical protein